MTMTRAMVKATMRRAAVQYWSLLHTGGGARGSAGSARAGEGEAGWVGPVVGMAVGPQVYSGSKAPIGEINVLPRSVLQCVFVFLCPV